MRIQALDRFFLAGPWTGRRLLLTVLAGFAFFVISNPALVLLLAFLASRAMPYDDLGVSFFLVIVGTLLLAPFLWLAWAMWTFALLRTHGGSRIRSRLSWIRAGFVFLGATPLLYSGACFFMMFFALEQSKSWNAVRNYGGAELIAIAGGVSLAGLSLLLGRRAQRKSSDLEPVPR